METALCFDGRLRDELEASAMPLHRLPTPRASRPLTVLRARQALVSLLEAGRFDRVVCHTQWTQAIFGASVRRVGLPLAIWVHGPLSGRHWSERWAGKTRPDLAICTSHFVARTVPDLYEGVPATVIHPPVDAVQSPLSSVERNRLRDDLNTPADAIVIAQASRTEAWKGHTVLLDALGRLRDNPRWIWWQIGGAQRPFEAAYLESLHQRAAALGISDRVRFVGERSDVRCLLAAADIHCQANLNPEPFGIAFVEALAAGLPVVTVAMGGALEIVDESCGILVPPADHVALAAALGRLIDDPGLRARLSAAAPARARAVSDPATQIRALKQALDGMTAH